MKYRLAHPGRFALVAAALLTVGCAQQRLRDEADALLRQGEFERASATLTEALASYPDSTVLRSGLLQARNEALTRLLVQAATARASGRLEEAEAALQRARNFDTGGQRVADLQAEIQTERQQRQALATAQAMVEAGKPDAALRHIAQALRDNPRQTDLLALQRRLEAELRRARQREGAGQLAEARPVTLDFRDANLRQVLAVVTRHSGVNFILDKDVPAELKVTTFLRSIKVQDAIELLVGTNQLAMKVIDRERPAIPPCLSLIWR